jgi:metallo-beta-lactamase family protein
VAIVLLDAAHVQEEDAERANRRAYTKHHPALPLYTVADAEKTVGLLAPRPYDTPFDIPGGLHVTLRRAGHILGSATVDLGGVVYSGDLGRYDRPILPDPAAVHQADILVLESTYGDRTHPPAAEAELARVIREAAVREGMILIPAFAVARTQELLWLLHRFERSGAIPSIPVFCDSPMAADVTEVYGRHPEDYDTEMAAALKAGDRPLTTRQTDIVRSVSESQQLNHLQGPAIIIASSGMATGGRILHHLALRLPDPRTTVLLVGYQAAGTRGRALQDGAGEIVIFGARVPVHARVVQVPGLSGHADRDETLRWLGGFERTPRVTYLVHGETQAAAALATAIRDRYAWDVRVAAAGETAELTP